MSSQWEYLEQGPDCYVMRTPQGVKQFPHCTIAFSNRTSLVFKGKTTIWNDIIAHYSEYIIDN